MSVVSWPGVYIFERVPTAPIEGIGMSTPGFVGVTASGELNKPVKLTSWDAFKANYGERPVPGFFLWYAVRGFFQNAGQAPIWVVRASNGAYARADFNDRASPGNKLFQIRLRDPGMPPTYKISITESHLLAKENTNTYAPTSTYTVSAAGPLIQLPDASAAAQFRGGDWVNLGSGNERVLVRRVTGDKILVGTNLPVNATATAIRLSDASADTTTIRIASTIAGVSRYLVPGTVLTINPDTPTSRISQVIEAVAAEPLATNPPTTSYQITFREPIGAPLSMAAPAAPAPIQSEEFNLSVIQGTTVVGSYPNLSVDAAHSRYFVDAVNQEAGVIFIELSQPPPSSRLPISLPAAISDVKLGADGVDNLAKGADENLTTIGAADYQTALDELRSASDVRMIAIPDATLLKADDTTAVQQSMIEHCERLGDRIAILDARPNLKLFTTDDSIEAQRRTVDSMRGYAALYYPWLRVQRASVGPNILVPPSGHMCGVIARSDALIGFHKCPANEIVAGALGVSTTMTDVDHGQLNLMGINVVRVPPQGGQPILMGGRTTATHKSWLHLSTRRLFLYLEKSIQLGISYAVFAPNNLGLWRQLKRSISAFLTTVYNTGALFGALPKDAFYVRIDEALNPFSEQALGRLHLEIGARPTFPAEFIIVSIGIWEGGSEVSES